MKGSNVNEPNFFVIQNEIVMKMYKQFFPIMLIGTLFLTGTALMGQQNPSGDHPPLMKQRPKYMFDRLMDMQSELQLTEGQMSRLGELKTAFDQDLQQYYESRKNQREVLQSQINEYKLKLAEVLTEEQLAKVKDMEAERHAQHKAKAHTGKIYKEGLRQEMKAYHDQNIRPVMLQQRAKLEKKISAEDKALIAGLRAKFEANRQEKQKMKQNPNHSKEDFRALRESHEAGRETLKGLVEKYNEDIDALMAEVKDQQEQWNKDKRAIHEKYAPGKEEGGKGKGEKQKHQPGHHPGMGMHSKGQEMRKGHFLLLDPNAPAETPAAAAVTANVNVYPNPAANQMTLEYTLLKAGNVRIELRDKEGNMVKVAEEGPKAAGGYSLPIDATQLKDGVYYLTIISQGQRTAQKVVVAK